MEFTTVLVRRDTPKNPPPTALSRLSVELQQHVDEEVRKHEISMKRHLQSILKSQEQDPVAPSSPAPQEEDQDLLDDDDHTTIEQEQIRNTLKSILSRYLESSNNSPRDSLSGDEEKLSSIPQESAAEFHMSRTMPLSQMLVKPIHSPSSPPKSFGSPTSSAPTGSPAGSPLPDPSLGTEESALEDSSSKATDETREFLESFGAIDSSNYIGEDDTEEYKLDESLNEAPDFQGMNRRRAIAHSGMESDVDTPLPKMLIESMSSKANASVQKSKRIVASQSAEIGLQSPPPLRKSQALKKIGENKISRDNANGEIAELIRRSLQLCLSNSKLADLLPESLTLKYKDKQCPVESVCFSQCARIRKVFNISAQMLINSVNDMRGGLSGGRSGSFFFATADKQFIIKSMSVEEMEFLEKSFMHEYTSYVVKEKNTLLPRFYAIIKIHSGPATFKFLVMNNVFRTHLPLNEIYDLKGSKLNRMASKKERLKGEKAVLKDVDFLNSGRRIHLGETSLLAFCCHLRKDCKFLASKGIMDYSLLIGVHRIDESKNLLKTSEDTSTPSTSADTLRASVKSVGARKPFASVFQGEYGGILARDFDGEKLSEVYFIGIIDILQQYTWKKEFETMIKSISHEKKDISSMEVDQYMDRFLRFVMDSVLQTNPETLEQDDSSVGPQRPCRATH
eukprot:TRINITY_DN686_c0_g4_i1.p1 TRINITY_DN686_c0_g4~~TRINITY_DN686_c0_g4_i1.p1  ORF type:complete len:679 (+),score=151.88 TRINITY_DN686_c0_g4_i1:2166-4202(+)